MMDSKSKDAPIDTITAFRRRITTHKVFQPVQTTPMKFHLDALHRLLSNPVINSAFLEAVAHVEPHTEGGADNPWQYTTGDDFVSYFDAWFTDVPRPDSCLGSVLPFSWFYKNNPSARFFLNDFKSCTDGVTKGTEYIKEIYDWMVKFILIRGEFMNSPQSIPDYVFEEYKLCKHIHMDDFITPVEGFISYNEFFTRRLDIDEKTNKNPRPISKPSDDSIAVASADSVVNLISSDLKLDTDITVKDSHLSMSRLLEDSLYAERFVGGTAVSCVLLPHAYHHFHAPVSGDIVESKDIPGIYNGEGIDAEHWFNDVSNPGSADTNFSVFETFHRAYYIIDTGRFGCVALVAVGLNTVSKIQPTLCGDVKHFVEPGTGTPVGIKKGDKIGNFAYGGSLNILLFEKGVMPALSLQMGNRLGQMYEKKGGSDNNGTIEDGDDFNIRPACVQRDFA